MLVHRWQAAVLPSKSQIRSLYELEGLDPKEESLPQGKSIENHYHAFDEVRTIIEGELMFNIAGNQLLLRSGDKIVIPANTRHSFKANGSDDCVCIVAHKSW